MSGFQRCFVAIGSRAPAASAVMLAAVAAGVPSAEIPAAVETPRCMPAASHVEAARAAAAYALGRVSAAKQMEATRVRWFCGGVRKVPARESPRRPPPEFASLKTRGRRAMGWH